MKYIKQCVIVVQLSLAIVLLSSCTMANYGDNQSSADKLRAENQATIFFHEHPEYLSSQHKEALLFSIFKELTNEPQNNKLNMYQLLNISHEKANVLMQFDDDDDKLKGFSS